FADHRNCRAPLGTSISWLHLKVDQDGVAILHQRVGRVTKLGLLARPLPGQQGLGVGGRLVGLIGAPLAVEVDARIAGVIRWLAWARVLALEALERSPRLDQRAVHGKVLVA